MERQCSDVRNNESRRPYPNSGAALCAALFHISEMEESGGIADQPNWFLREWMAHFGRRQASLVNELDWTRRKASEVWNDDQSYRRETVNELAAWLGIEPFELLMPPEQALALRRLRESAFAIAAEPANQAFRMNMPAPAPEPSKPKRKRTGRAA